MTEQLPTIAEELDQALVAKGVTEEVIEQLMQRAIPHARPIEDDDQYKAAEEARKEIKKVRLIGEKGIDAVDRRYLDLRQASLAKKKELLERINAPEVMILQYTREYERKKQEEEAERQRLIAEMQEQRKADILATGATFTPGPPEHRYSIGGHSWAAREIIEADHETFQQMLRSARMVQEEIAAAKAEEERKAQEERERIAAEAEALRQQQAEMARREAEMKAREEQMQRQVNEVRRGELMALGCEVVLDRISVAANGKYLFSLHTPTLHELSDTQWADEILAAKAAIEERNLWQAEVAALDAEIKSAPMNALVGPQQELNKTISDLAWKERQAEAEDQEVIESVLQSESDIPNDDPWEDFVLPAPKVLVPVERERLLKLLFSVQEVLPHAYVDGSDKWNDGIKALAEEVMELRRELKDETLGP